MLSNEFQKFSKQWRPEICSITKSCPNSSPGRIQGLDAVGDLQGLPEAGREVPPGSVSQQGREGGGREEVPTDCCRVMISFTWVTSYYFYYYHLWFSDDTPRACFSFQTKRPGDVFPFKQSARCHFKAVNVDDSASKAYYFLSPLLSRKCFYWTDHNSRFLEKNRGNWVWTHDLKFMIHQSTKLISIAWIML